MQAMALPPGAARQRCPRADTDHDDKTFMPVRLVKFMVVRL